MQLPANLSNIQAPAMRRVVLESATGPLQTPIASPEAVMPSDNTHVHLEGGELKATLEPASRNVIVTDRE